MIHNIPSAIIGDEVLNEIQNEIPYDLLPSDNDIGMYSFNNNNDEVDVNQQLLDKQFMWPYSRKAQFFNRYFPMFKFELICYRTIIFYVFSNFFY